MESYSSANLAFVFLVSKILSQWVPYGDTLAIFNEWFYMDEPMDNFITQEERKWSLDYAEYEWQWYLSWDRSIKEIWERAKIWKMIADENQEVNSNYWYQWQREWQLDYVIEELQRDPFTRRASFTIYDAKEYKWFWKDTPCTYAVNFYQKDGLLNMNVMMRSNDIWFWFCNDQYCFSRLLELVAQRTWLWIWRYFHFVNNLHIYNRHIPIARSFIF